MDGELDHQVTVMKESFLASLTDKVLFPTEYNADHEAIAKARLEHLAKLRTARKRKACQKTVVTSKGRNFLNGARSTSILMHRVEKLLKQQR